VPIEGKYFGKMETADIVVETDKVDGLRVRPETSL